MTKGAIEKAKVEKGEALLRCERTRSVCISLVGFLHCESCLGRSIFTLSGDADCAFLIES